MLPLPQRNCEKEQQKTGTKPHLFEIPVWCWCGILQNQQQSLPWVLTFVEEERRNKRSVSLMSISGTFNFMKHQS